MSKNEEKQLKTLQAVREGIKTRIFSFISSPTASSSFYSFYGLSYSHRFSSVLSRQGMNP